MSTVTRDQVLDFIYQENQLLDEQRYEQWLALFDAQGMYWIPAQADQTDPLQHISLCYESVDMLAMRVARLRHPQAHGLAQDIRTSRLTGNVSFRTRDDAGLHVRGHLIVHEWQGQRLRHFAGQVDYRLDVQGTTWSIHEKKISLVNVEAAFESIQILL
ncbi:aromatic-ring-hydroxylating dioxygenase subunit beta [Alcaligenes sp. SDU_A2]|uniref:aromatic-ring-hydroxylating dioxygenase subunit beta n=1 Tax=Alcaligenes sp. SDU_A2 TaxID=3136634 RepID=UPI00311D8237